MEVQVISAQLKRCREGFQSPAVCVWRMQDISHGYNIYCLIEEYFIENLPIKVNMLCDF